MKNKRTEDEKFISTLNLAKRWNLSPSSLYMHRSGTQNLTRYRFGRAVRYALAEVEKFEEQILMLPKGGRNGK